MAEQLTYFDTLLDDGDHTPNPNGEDMTSSITQILLGYNLTETIGLQANIPIISRTFTRITEEGIDHGDETGFGDISLLGLFSPFRWVGVDSVVRTTLMAGIKLPSGSSSRLREELDEVDDDTAIPEFPDVPGRGLPGFPTEVRTSRGTVTSNHTTGGETESGLHGHDLALGSGSVDGVFGARIFGSWKRLFASGSVQYFVRSQGRFNYQYANEILWRVGPGVFLALDDVALGRGYTLNLAAVFSGESKGKDTLSGVSQDDTAYTGLYLGPSMTFTWGESLQATLGGDIPVEQKTTELQLVPDFRITAAVTWRF